MLGSIPEESTYGANSASGANSSSSSTAGADLARGFGRRREPPTPVVIEKGDALGTQGGSSNVHDGTLNGAPILIKVIHKYLRLFDF
jgi:hypothetical protein